MTTRNCKAPMNEVACLNDALRQTFTGGKVVMTAAVAALPEEQLARMLDRVRTFDQFTKDNDPYGEHDFGIFDLDGEKFFFKCDYYNEDMSAGSEDPSDPTQTVRLFTIGFVAEY